MTLVARPEFRLRSDRRGGWHAGVDFEPGDFGKRHAGTYDDDTRRTDTEATVDFLADLAGEGPVLELAVGTGRVALPLADRGLRVDGVDISLDMVAELRAKPGGDRLPVAVGDMAALPVRGRYGLVFVVYNSLHNLMTQDAQVRCFREVAACLADGGVFVVESGVPSRLHRLRDDQYVDAELVEADEVRLDVARHDPVTQQLHENHVMLSADGIRLYPVVTRYVWPSEMDLMARLAGLRLLQRWATWQRQPFTAASRSHISVYGR